MESSFDDRPIGDSLDALVRDVEAHASSPLRASILLVDDSGERLRHGAAPSLPPGYKKAIDGLPIGPSVGSCGTAAHRNQPVYVADIADDPLWAELRELALANHLRACWSTPIRSSSGAVLGTVAIYHGEPREPGPTEIDLIDVVSKSAALLIERHRSELQLREREGHLSAVIAQTSAGIAETDVNGAFIRVNDRYCELVGRSRNELLGMRMQDITHPDDLMANLEKFANLVATGESFTIEKRYTRPDGTDVWVNNSVSRIEAQAGGEPTILAAVIDISDRKAAEEALRESEERYRGLISATNRVLYRHNADWSEMIALAGGDFLADTAEPDPDWLDKYVHPDHHADVLAAIRKAIETKSPFELEHRVIRADGTIGWTVSRSIPILDRKGKIIEWFGAASDVSDRHEAEDALRESEERFRNMADHAPVMMWMTDPDGSCTYLNRQWYEFTGQTEAEALGLGWLDAVHPDDADRSGAIFGEANAAHAPFSLEYRLRRHDGAYRWAIDAASPRFAPDGGFLGYIGSVIEIHERKREEWLRKAQNRVLELAVQDRPPSEVLESLVTIIEEESEGEVIGSILLLDKERKHLQHGAAPSLPDSYNDAIHGIAIGPGVGSCGTAAHLRQPVYVADIAADPLWKDFKDLALEHGLRACWSIPILGTSGDILGTFGMYYREPREPRDDDLRLVDYVTRTAALFIERHEASQALRERSEEFYTLADNIPALAWMAYADGHIFWYNRRWYEYTGTTPESQEGWGWESVHDPEMLPQVVEEWKASLDTGKPFEMTFPLKGGDGEFRPFLTRVVPIHDESGTIVRWFGTNVDVSDQELAHQQLRQQSQTLETLNRVGSELAGDLDLESVVQQVTDAGVELTGAEFGAFFYNVIDAAGEAYMLFTLSGAKRSQFEGFGMPRNTEVFAPTFKGLGVLRSDDITKDPRYGKNAPYQGMPKGHLPVRSYLAVPVRGRSGDVIGGLFFGHAKRRRFTEAHESLMVAIAAQAAIAMDNARLYRAAQVEIEQRVKAEQRLTELNESLETRVMEEVERRTEAEDALRQSQKMETIGQLSGGIAHDFNNLLQIITGNLDILKRSLPEDSPRLLRSTENAIKGAERAAILTQRLLAFSRRQPLAPKVIDPNKLVSGMSELLHRTLGETIDTETVLGSGLWRVEADPNQLETALLNLAINSRDAMPDGGKLTIETANTHIDRDYAARNSGVIPGQYVVVCVSDTGTGMDEATAERAFDPFFTTKEVGKGTGLGLSMVYGFVKQSGGHLKIYSELGVGTTIRIYLPRHHGPEDSAADQPDSHIAEAGDGETILVCEDDDDVRAYSVETLRELGYRVIEAADGESALRLLGALDGSIDLLFTDVVLPGGMTGAVVAERARAMHPQLKVLFTTGYARNAIVHHGRLDPGVELLSKPFSYSDLAARIRDLLDQR